MLFRSVRVVVDHFEDLVVVGTVHAELGAVLEGDAVEDELHKLGLGASVRVDAELDVLDVRVHVELDLSKVALYTHIEQIM